MVSKPYLESKYFESNCIRVRSASWRQANECGQDKKNSKQEYLRNTTRVLSGDLSAQGCDQTAHSCRLGGAGKTEDNEAHATG
jgi:hypothetical protein